MPRTLDNKRNLDSVFKNGIRTTSDLENICYAQDGNYIDTAFFAIPDEKFPNRILIKLPLTAFYNDDINTPVLLPKKDQFGYIISCNIPSQFILGAINKSGIISNPNYTKFHDYKDLIPIDPNLLDNNSTDMNNLGCRYIGSTQDSKPNHDNER